MVVAHCAKCQRPLYYWEDVWYDNEKNIFCEQHFFEWYDANYETCED